MHMFNKLKFISTDVGEYSQLFNISNQESAEAISQDPAVGESDREPFGFRLIFSPGKADCKPGRKYKWGHDTA